MLANVTYFLITIYEYIDIDYWSWLWVMAYPMLLTFILPLCIILFLYASVLFLYMYKWRYQILTACCDADVWNGARHFLAALWDAQGRIWHGYEVIGMENIPSDTGALVIYYHGAIPIDMYYLQARIVLTKRKPMKAVGDRFLFKIPGFRLLMDVIGVITGSVSEGIQIVQQGNLLAIAPGGVREAYFSDNYDLLWGNRVGFARIAQQGNVPIIPVFTENCREAFRAVSWGRGLFRWIYERTRLPIVPIYGMFPVKLRTHIGRPILPDPTVAPHVLAEQVADEVRKLIKLHQRLPGSFWAAFLQRFYTQKMRAE